MLEHWEGQSNLGKMIHSAYCIQLKTIQWRPSKHLKGELGPWVVTKCDHVLKNFRWRQLTFLDQKRLCRFILTFSKLMTLIGPLKMPKKRAEIQPKRFQCDWNNQFGEEKKQKLCLSANIIRSKPSWALKARSKTLTKPQNVGAHTVSRPRDSI